jgi:hypothetical protein
MAGCYQCGLPEGSDVRLCETCYRNRFHREMVVVDTSCEEECSCIEISPRVQRWMVSGGAALCVGILGLAVLVQSQPSHVSPSALEKEFIRNDAGYVAVSHERELGALTVSGAQKS